MSLTITCCNFPTVSIKEYLNINHIHPLMQRPCSMIVDAFSSLDNIRIGIFGSSVSWRCSQFSDLDIVIRIDDGCPKTFTDVRTEISLFLDEVEVSTDIIDFKSLDKNECLYEEIVNTAVTIVDNIM